MWAFQEDAHDAWDYDSVMENILIDMPWHGQMRKLMIHPGRMGFVVRARLLPAGYAQGAADIARICRGFQRIRGSVSSRFLAHAVISGDPGPWQIGRAHV